MKSAIFESINDRSNIANAYLKMVNESNEAVAKGIAEFAELFEDKDCPLCIYDDTADPSSNIIDLFDIRQKYNEPSYYDHDTDEYYIARAFDEYSDSALYSKLLEKDRQYRLTPEELYRMNGDCVMTIGDLESDLGDIGRDIESGQHKDDVEVEIPEWAAVYYVNDDDSGLTPEDKKMADDYKRQIESQGYHLAYDGENLGFCRYPEFGLAGNCIKFYLVKNSSEKNESVNESTSEWFDSYGNLVKDLPDECIEDCTAPGRDAYEKCKYWVDKLGFANGLDIPLAKGYLKWTGGWEDDEIASLDDEETAIKILWILANDAKEGLDILSIGDGGRFDDGSSSTVTESRFRNHKVILTNIQWPNGTYDDGMNLPGRDSMTIEVGDDENIDNVIRNVYIDSYGVAPVNFRIARNIDLGFVEVDDVKKSKKSRKNEMVSQSDIDKLKKKNPKLKDISEER